MKTLTFTYTKTDSTISNRVLLTTSTPSTMYEGYDISELESLEQAMVMEALKKTKDKHKEEILQILSDFDITHNYRKFDAKKMNNIIEEKL